MRRDLARELFRTYRSSIRKKKEVVEDERIKRDEPERLNTLLNELVVKEVQGSGGYGMLVGPTSSKKEIEIFREENVPLIAEIQTESQKYGANTKWCISSNQTNYFDNYSNDSLFFFVIDRERIPIEGKIKSIVNLINENPTLVHKDLEDELWYMV